MKLSTKLTIAMVALVVATVAAVGLLTYRKLENAILPRALERTETHAALVASQVESYAHGARADISGFRAAVSLNGLVRAWLAGGTDPADGTSLATWRDRLASRFVTELTSKPAYSQLRIIGTDNDGKEILRVDRTGSGGSIRVVPGPELQAKGDRDYFRKVIALGPDEIYVSPVDLNQEKGVIEVPHVPTLRVAAPIFSEGGRPFGIVIINVDMRPVFAHVRSSARPGGEIFVVNERGDYLVNPDRQREFGSQLGNPTNWKADLPELAVPLTSVDSTSRVVRDKAGERGGGALATARPAGGEPIGIIETVPNSVFMAPANAVQQSTLLVGLAAILCAGALAMLIARTLTKPLVQMTRAVEGIGSRGPADVPIDVGGEVGVLARAFARVVKELKEKAAAFEREVEDHRRTESARERYEQQLQLFGSAVESSNDAVVTKTLDGVITGWNAAAERLFGYTAGEAVGQSIHIIVPGDRRGDEEKIIEQIRWGEAVEPHETIRIAKDGTPIDVLLSVSPIISRNGTIVGATKIAHDIREIRKTQVALKQETEERQRIFETSQDLILVTDPQGNFVQVSPSSMPILGYEPEEMIGHSAVDFIYHGDLEDTRAHMRAARNGRILRNFVTRYVAKDGKTVVLTWMGTWSEPVRRYFFIGRDMTEIQQAQESLLESERMARGIIETALDAFVQIDEAGVIVDWNSQAEKIFGWSRAEAVGRVLGDLIVPEAHRGGHKYGLAHFLQTGEASILGRRLEIEAQRRNGSEIKVELSVTAFQRRGGYVFNGFIRDLTDRIAAESQARQAQKMEAIGQLTGGVAHDFNNILTVITGTVEILAEGVADKPELAGIAQMIDEAAERGADLTRHLLAFARKQPLQPREIDVNTLILSASKLLRPTLGEYIEIETILAEDPWLAFVDPNQLTTAILNLALNARDAMPKGGKLIVETINSYLDDGYASQHSEVNPGEYVLIAMSDTGTGISANLLDKVFEPFFTTKEIGKGTGLGLSMVYGFVKQSGGHIKIYSEEAHGTTIKLYLPRSKELAQGAVDITRIEKIMGGSELILVVEDDLLVRNYVVTQVRSLGYRTLSAANADEALNAIRSNPAIDLLFTDVIMPGTMNGRQLVDEVRKMHSDFKVLYTSGYTENAIVHHGRLDAGVLLLAKPYRKADLARMIRLALKGTAPAG
jgi:PAS domain S-box-containing protein